MKAFTRKWAAHSAAYFFNYIRVFSYDCYEFLAMRNVFYQIFECMFLVYCIIESLFFSDLEAIERRLQFLECAKKEFFKSLLIRYYKFLIGKI